MKGEFVVQSVSVADGLVKVSLDGGGSFEFQQKGALSDPDTIRSGDTISVTISLEKSGQLADGESVRGTFHGVVKRNGKPVGATVAASAGPPRSRDF